MKKILFIVTQSDFGGAQRYIFDLVVNLKNEFLISVAAGPKGGDELLNRLEKNGIAIHRLKHLKRAINPCHDWLAYRELKNLIKNEKPDIVHLNSSKAGVLGSLAAARLPSRVIYTAHGWTFNEPNNPLKRQIYLGAEKWTSRYKDRIICVSEYDRRSALKYDIASPEKLITIHNGLDWQKLEFLSKKTALDFLAAKVEISNNKLIGAVANLYPAKGLTYLIKTARFIKSPCQILIIGEGPERRNLEQQIAKYQLQNKVLLLGALPQAYRYLRAFDFFILPSVKEGFPYAILEAMAAGLPIVATSVGGLPEIIEDGRNGFLVAPQNPLALAEKINYLLENPDQARLFGQTNLEKIKEFDLKKMTQKTKEIYFTEY